MCCAVLVRAYDEPDMRLALVPKAKLVGEVDVGELGLGHASADHFGLGRTHLGDSDVWESVNRCLV